MESAGDCILNQALAQSDAQVAGQKLYQVLCFQGRGSRERFRQQIGLGVLAARGAKSSQQTFSLDQR